jgi:hypothetical protein
MTRCGRNRHPESNSINSAPRQYQNNAPRMRLFTCQSVQAAKPAIRVFLWHLIETPGCPPTPKVDNSQVAFQFVLGAKLGQVPGLAA